jgi:hypothetical protein
MAAVAEDESAPGCDPPQRDPNEFEGFLPRYAPTCKFLSGSIVTLTNLCSKYTFPVTAEGSPGVRSRCPYGLEFLDPKCCARLDAHGNLPKERHQAVPHFILILRIARQVLYQELFLIK